MTADTVSRPPGGGQRTPPAAGRAARGAPGARIARAAVAVGAIAVVAYGLFRAGLATAPPPATPGAPAPDFSATTLDSVAQVRTLADYRGSPVLLNVWATWCDPCREEMPSIQRLYDAYRDKGLRVVAISVDDRGAEPLLREFVAEHHLTFDIVHDQESAVMRTYQVRGVPQTFLISRAGDIVATRFVADWSSPESHRLVDSVLFNGAQRR